MPEGQNIIDLAFDVPKLEGQIDRIVEKMAEIETKSIELPAKYKAAFDAITSQMNTTIKPGSDGGFGELKAQMAASEAQSAKFRTEIDRLNKALLDQKKYNDDLAQSQHKQSAASKDQAEAESSIVQAIGPAKSAQQELAEILANNQIQTKQLSEQKKRLAQDYRNGIIDLDQYRTSLAGILVEQGEITASNYGLNLAIRNLSKEAINADGSLEKMKATLELVKYAYSKMTEEEKKSAAGIALQQKSKDLSEEINRQKISIGDYTSNIGRYAESLSPLFNKVGEQIDKIKLKNEELAQSFKQQSGGRAIVEGFTAKPGDDPGKTAQLNQLTEEYNRNNAALASLTRTQQIGFQVGQGGVQQINNLSKAYVEMASSGTQSEDFLKEFSGFIQKAKADMKSYQDQLNAPGKTDNFTQSLHILETSLTQAKTKLQQLTEAGKLNTAEGKSAEREVRLLTELVGQQSVGFNSLQRELMSTGRAVGTVHSQLQLMEKDGLQNTTAYTELKNTFNQLNAEFTANKSKLAEFNEGQKILTSTAPKLVALTSAAKGLGGIYAAGAGAAALFAGENEHVQKELNKLVAVMTFLQGVNEIHELLLKKNAIGTALFGTATTAATVAVEANTIVTEVNTGAIEGNAAAEVISTQATKAATIAQQIYTFVVGESTGALKILRIALASTGVGLLLLGLGALVIAFSKSSEATEKQEKELRKFEEQQKEAAESAKQLADIQNEAGKSYVDAKAKIGELSETISLAKQGFIDKKEAVKLYNETLGKATGEVKNLDEAEKGLTDNADAYIKFTFLKAAANIALQQAAQKAFDAELLREQNPIQKEGIIKIQKQEVTETSTGVDVAKNKAEQNKKSLAGIANYSATVLDKQGEDLNKIADNFFKKAAEISSKFKLTPEKAKEKKDDASDTFKREEEARKAAFETQKKIQEDKIASDKAILESDRSTFEQRQQAAMDFYTDSIKLAQDNEDFLLKEVDFKADEEKRKVKGTAQEKAKAIADIDKLSALERLKIQTDYGSASANLFTQLLKQLEDSQKKHDAALKAHDKSLYEQRLDDIKNSYDQQLVDLDEQYLKQRQKDAGNKEKLLSDEKEYNKKKLKIQLDQQVAVLQAQIDFAQEQLEIQRKLVEAEPESDQKTADLDKIAEAEGSLAAMRIKLHGLVAAAALNANKNITDSNATTFKEWISNLQNVANVVEYVFKTIGGFIDANVTKEKNRLQALTDANNEYSDQETERINNSTLSEQDKAAKLIQLKAETDAKNREFAHKQKEEDIKKAKFDKASAIASIILNTAVAISKDLKATPFSLPQLIFDAAVGAAQLAIAIATPVPTYKYGTEDHPGGPAKYGDVPEMVYEPGRPGYLADKERTGILPKHTKVVPLTANEVNDTMSGSVIRNTADRLALVEAIEKSGSNDAWKIAQFQNDAFKKALEDNNQKVVNNIKVVNDFGWIEYVNKNIFGK